MISTGMSVKLGDVCRICSTLVDPRQPQYCDMPHVGGANIESKTGRLANVRTAREEELKSGKYLFDETMVLYCKIRPYLMKVATPSFRGLCSADIYPLSPDGESIVPDYLSYLLLSPHFTNYAIRGSNRAGMPKVNRDHLFAYEFVLPPLIEQRRIVARIKECLERVEEIESLRHEALQEANAALPSMLNETFVELTAQYDDARIGDVAVETRYGTSRKCTASPTGTAILRIPNVVGGFVNFDELKYCSLNKRELECVRLEAGDLLFVRTNGSRDLVGRCAVYEGNAGDQYGFASYLIRVRLDQTRLLPHFLAFFLNSTHGRTEIDKRRRTSAGQFNINSENLRNIEIPVPPIDIQKDAIRALQEREELVTQLQSQLREAEALQSHLRESILRKAFAGEL